MSNENKPEFICPFLGNFTTRELIPRDKLIKAEIEMVGAGVLNCFKERCRIWDKDAKECWFIIFFKTMSGIEAAFRDLVALDTDIVNTIRLRGGKKDGDG